VAGRLSSAQIDRGLMYTESARAGHGRVSCNVLVTHVQDLSRRFGNRSTAVFPGSERRHTQQSRMTFARSLANRRTTSSSKRLDRGTHKGERTRVSLECKKELIPSS